MNMRIIGFGIKRLFGEKNEVKNPKLTLNQNIEVKDISKEKLDVGSDEAIIVKFLFSIEYSDGVGKVGIEGNVVLLPDKEELKEFNKTIKEKKIPDRFKTQLFNFIIMKCNIKALSMEDELNLPYHVAMPKLGPMEKD